MATRYWVATGNPGTLNTSNTAGNWNTSADGTGSTGVPAANDHLVFGHPDTVAAANLDKLASRKQEGTLKGSGDER